ncbi:hypothetical protein [Kozakia baliensis]|uniref:Lipoprotein n=1 Tax=Kozakia baliensis TaxID=153496 RepID=A0A1D8UXI1_9PROT|nr:hypothetical protein [Kozakia baliensis]AOX18306.1 hypothetical protein A0U89_11640 [Kozakia baliensis]
MRLRGSAFLLGSALTLAACAQKPVVQRVVPPNPFGYQKVSAVCHVSPVTKAADGSLSATMTVRSDDGLCALSVQKAGNTSYASFGVSPAPEHGKAFLYNYDDHTYVTYTPQTAYSGTDSFTATLIPGGGQPRAKLHVVATVDATGVTIATAKPPAVTEPKKSAVPASKKKTTATTRRRHTAHH